MMVDQYNEITPGQETTVIDDERILWWYTVTLTKERWTEIQILTRKIMAVDGSILTRESYPQAVAGIMPWTMTRDKGSNEGHISQDMDDTVPHGGVS